MDTEIMASVIGGDRPELDCEDWRAARHPDVVALIEQCWDQDPDSRPPFAAITTRLEAIALQLAAEAAAEERAELDSSDMASAHLPDPDTAKMEEAMAAMQRRLDDSEAAALATEKLMDATRRRLDEYEAALREEQARSTLAEREAAVLREERDGLRVSSAHLVEEAARLRALADAMQDLEAARALRVRQARAEANLNSDLEAEAKKQKAALKSRLQSRTNRDARVRLEPIDAGRARRIPTLDPQFESESATHDVHDGSSSSEEDDKASGDGAVLFVTPASE